MKTKLGEWFTNKFTSTDLAPEKDGEQWFFPIGDISGFNYGDVGKQQFLKDFLEVPEVNTVINYKAWAQSLVELELVSKTTLKPAPDSHPINKLLKNPNFFQSQKEFFRQTSMFRDIFGDEIMFFLSPVGMSKSIKAMFTLPPQFTRIKYPQNQQPFFLNTELPEGIEYSYYWNGKWYPVKNEMILHLNDNNVDQKEENYLSGSSKLLGLQPCIKNIRAAYEARNVILENRGAIGILANGAKDGTGSTAPMSPKEKERLQKEFKKYGVMKRQWRYILTSLNLKWQQISTDLDKLRVYEETEESFKMICNNLGTPYELFKGGKDGLFGEEKEQVQKQFYQDTVIPTVQERIKALNSFLGLDESAFNLTGTFDHLPIFQEDIKERTEALNTLITALNNALSVNAISMEDYKAELEAFNIGN